MALYRTATTSEEKREAYLLLCNTAIRVDAVSARNVNEIVKFWDKNIKMILLLLEFIRVEQEGDQELHLKVTTKTIPCFLQWIT